jgi:ABC-2 type transport system ATP-binding protein
MPVVEIENLTKDFPVGFWRKRPLRALDNLCLQVHKGEVFGFLGPNGAGKSTTLKILMNLLHPTSGSARILGKSVDTVSMHQVIGYLPENPYFYDYLTPAELLTYMGRLFGLREHSLSQKVDALLENVGLTHVRNLHLRKFSKGMVASLKARGVTVFFSSHILPDVEAICDRVAILNKGKLQEVGALEDILKVGIEGHEVILAGWRAEMIDVIRKWCDEVRPMGDRLQLRAKNRGQLEGLLSFAFEHKLELISVNTIRPSLEEYFQSAVSGRQSPVAGHQ